MFAPTNHHMIIIDADGNATRGRVIGVSAFNREVVDVEVVIGDMLPLGKYAATYRTYTRASPGTYVVHSFSFTKNLQWVAKGIFTYTRGTSTRP